jgi:ribosomal protein S18 acetylase RimI-like enzyme
MHRLIGEAARLHQAVRLAVVKINPALRLYERLGFQTHYRRFSVLVGHTEFWYHGVR